MDYGVITAAAVARIIGSARIQALVTAGDLGHDTLSTLPDEGSLPFASGWVFQGVDNDLRPLRDVQSTGTSAITVGVRAGWATPNQGNTAKFPTLRILVWSDVFRDSADPAMIRRRDAVSRCSRIADALAPLFHDVDNQWQCPGLHNSTQSSSLSVSDVFSLDGVVMGEMRFSLTTD
jgi:hypothetical protein